MSKSLLSVQSVIARTSSSVRILSDLKYSTDFTPEASSVAVSLTWTSSLKNRPKVIVLINFWNAVRSFSLTSPVGAVLSIL